MRGRVGWARLARPTEFDFIEAPSQFLEQWIFDHDVLRRFALHVETGEPIPERRVQLLRAARDLGRGVQTQRQVFLSMVSLEYHDRDPRDLDTTAIWRDVAERWSPTTVDREAIYQSSWTHLPGYAALYGTYTKSKTVAEDLSEGFGSDLMNIAQARRYRDIVLGQGGLRPALDLVEEFKGQPHSLDAYRRWLR
jgi:thimet oligopeptidase